MSEHHQTLTGTGHCNAATPPTNEPLFGDGHTLTAIAKCVEERHTAANASGSGDDVTEKHMEAIERLMAHMAGIPASTPRGLLAKIRAFRLYTSDEVFTEGGTENELLASLIRDIERYFATS